LTRRFSNLKSEIKEFPGMSSENETKPDEQTGEQPVASESATGGDAAPADPTMADVLKAMQSQQEATARGFAELTSGLSQFVEKLGAVAAGATSQPAAPSKPSEPPAEKASSEESPAEKPAAEPAPQQAAASPAPQAAPAQPEATPPQAVQPPPVDPTAYAQQIPATGFPRAAPQAAVPAGYPAPGQPHPQTPTGFPPMQNPQAPVPQMAQPAPVQQPVPVQQPAPAAPTFPNLSEPIRVARDLIRGQRSAPAQVGPPQPQQQPQQPAQDDRWQRILFGHDLANNQALAALRDKLLEGLLGGERQATGLVGTILLFQAASAERMPQILKDVGEAYYRWNPRTQLGDDPLRDGLINWLRRKCEAAGVSNTIVLVRPGDRFESARHNAKQKGVEVTQVGGWVVLRDNGKVYTKANVAVK
jgi:hypothetical protein